MRRVGLEEVVVKGVKGEEEKKMFDTQHEKNHRGQCRGLYNVQSIPTFPSTITTTVILTNYLSR